jgi:hypothetical protein
MVGEAALVIIQLMLVLVLVLAATQEMVVLVKLAVEILELVALVEVAAGGIGPLIFLEMVVLLVFMELVGMVLMQAQFPALL